MSGSSSAGEPAVRHRDFECVPERFGGAAGGDQDGAGARVRRPRRQRTMYACMRLQVWHPQEAGDAWGDHRFEGGAVSRSSSSPARWSSMRAPAAADDASHASVMSLDDTAVTACRRGAPRHLKCRDEQPVRRLRVQRAARSRRAVAAPSRAVARGSAARGARARRVRGSVPERASIGATRATAEAMAAGRP